MIVSRLGTLRHEDTYDLKNTARGFWVKDLEDRVKGDGRCILGREVPRKDDHNGSE